MALGATSLSLQQGPDPEALTAGGGGGGVPASLQPFPAPAFRSPGFHALGGEGAGSGSRHRVGTALAAIGVATRGPGAAAVSGNLTRFCYTQVFRGHWHRRAPAPGEACAQCIIHTSVSIYIPAYSPIPAYNGLWPRRSWDHAAISICSRWLRMQRKGLGDRCGSDRLRATGAPVFSFCCVQRCSTIKETRLWCNTAQTAARLDGTDAVGGFLLPKISRFGSAGHKPEPEWVQAAAA